MADATHSEHKHEPTPVERFEQFAKDVLRVKKKDALNLVEREGKGELDSTQDIGSRKTKKRS